MPFSKQLLEVTSCISFRVNNNFIVVVFIYNVLPTFLSIGLHKQISDTLDKQNAKLGFSSSTQIYLFMNPFCKFFIPELRTKYMIANFAIWL